MVGYLICIFNILSRLAILVMCIGGMAYAVFNHGNFEKFVEGGITAIFFSLLAIGIMLNDIVKKLGDR